MTNAPQSAIETCIDTVRVSAGNAAARDLAEAATLELTAIRQRATDLELLVRAVVIHAWVCWRTSASVHGVDRWIIGIPGGGESHVLAVDAEGLPMLTDEVRAALKATAP